jgi:uncharacterized protein
VIVGVGRIDLSLPEGHSLKEKRMVLKSLVSRIKNTFNVSVAEVDNQDLWQTATIGIACVSNDGRLANEVLSKVINFIENQRGDAEMTDYQIEILHSL